MASRADAAKAVRRPPVHLIDRECDALVDLALGAESRQPEVAALLLSEIERAEIHSPDTIPPKAVTLGAEVAYLDERSNTQRSVMLVLPAEADIATGRVSVLTPIGAGLIGLTEGQSIDWPDREGRNHRLRVISVRQPPRAEAEQD